MHTPIHICVYTYIPMYTHTLTHTYVQVHYVNVEAMPCSRTEVDKAQSLPSRSLQSTVTVPCLLFFLPTCSVNCTLVTHP